MSLWTTFGLPRRHRDTRRTPAKLTVRLTVEELEPRNAPGSLLSVGGQTALSLAGSGSSAPIAATRANAAVASTPSVVASQTSSAPTTTQTTVPATPTTSGGTSGLVPSLAGNASTTPDADPFVDDASSPLAAAAPVAAPASANAAAASPAVNDFASSLPTIGGSPTATPAAVAAMPTQSGPDADLSYLPPPTVTLTAPAFVNYRGSPLLAVQATAGGANNTLNPTVEIDIDLQHDGSFTDPGDQNFASGTIGANGTAAITLTTPLSAGTYTLRARVADAEGNVGVSANATMQVDPNSGFVGSEALLDLAYGLPYGTPVPMGGSQSAGGENGTGTLTPGTPKPQDFSFLDFDKQSRVLVDVHSTQTANLSSLQSELTSQLGFATTLVTTDQNMVTGWLPINQILNLPNLDNFDSVDPVYKPIVNAVGSYPTDGDPVIHSDTFRSTFGVDGTGVKVGVMSTSINEVGGGVAASQATGDLPANVQILEDELDGQGTDEGRAMSEIVHHIAPGASIAFHSATNGQQDFANGIQQLVNAGAKVITDDVGYFDEPVFNNGVIGQAAESAVNQGVFYTSAAGNDADHAYFAPYRGIAATVGGTTGQFQDITGTGDALQTFSLETEASFGYRLIG